MSDDKRAVGAELVAAVIAIVDAKMRGLAGQAQPDPAQHNAVKQPWRGLGEPYRETVGMFLKDIASLGIDDLAVREPELALLAIIETSIAPIGE
jgi:hypothetical protein